ncbi:hypothetical protein EKN06_12380 [Croceicoccus ponticola]|uniref:Twin-arginine translocation pathway signal protein n=1 Tax=Croceicoccus ponticola TaxID=2217664 RepID=A0A437GVA5_9SPHN|nr:hypothetical protein [Croceicoccus ponticola]RVQ65725.1 hypothetical protein EKN06_12380 [Croceicoccus ponticola]
MTINTLTATRRAILGAIPATAAIAAVPAFASTHPDAAILAAWERRSAAFARLSVPAFDEQGEACRQASEAVWSEIDTAEKIIREAIARTVEGVEIQLWVAMGHSVCDRQSGLAITRRDLDYLIQHERDMDWYEQFILAALRSLKTMGA